LALTSDFKNVLNVFVFTNLNAIMNPVAAAGIFATASSVTETAVTAPAGSVIGTVGTNAINRSIAVSAAMQTEIFTPALLNALQSAVLNEYRELGVSKDVQDVAQVFFSVFPAATPITAFAPVTAPLSPATVVTNV
jgi:hypothetical protein